MSSFSARPEGDPRAGRRGRLGGYAGFARALSRSPRLVPEMARIAARGAADAVRSSNVVSSLLDAANARRLAPDLPPGFYWHDFTDIVEHVSRHADADSTVLELGCGGGRVTHHVAPTVKRLVATDVSSSMVQDAKRYLASAPNVRVEKTDGVTLSQFSDQSFDLVFAQGVLCYIEVMPLLALLAEIRRVLVPSGHLVLNLELIDNADNARQLLDRAISGARRGGRFGGMIDRPYALGQVERMCATAGLRLIAPEVDLAVATKGRSVVVAEAV